MRSRYYDGTEWRKLTVVFDPCEELGRECYGFTSLMCRDYHGDGVYKLGDDRGIVEGPRPSDVRFAEMLLAQAEEVAALTKGWQEVIDLLSSGGSQC